MSKAKIIAGICAVVGVISIAVAFLVSGDKTYSVSFDTDGGSHISMQTIKKGARVEKPGNPTKEEYTFLRWEYQNKEYDFTEPVQSDMTLKAVWEKVVQAPKYKVTFNVDGKTNTVEVSAVSEINVSTLGFEEKDGYLLKWYYEGKEYTFTELLTSDITIEGKYEKTLKYTVKFNSNGGTTVSSQTVNPQEIVTEPTNVKKDGYLLDGWYLNNKKYDFSTPVTGNITLTAKWTEDPNVKKYEVSFNSDGGSSVPSQRVMENKTASQPSNPTRSGYGFDGWYLNGSKYNFSTKVTKDIVLTAKWHELVKYTITFDSNGGSAVASMEVYEGSKVTKPSNPTLKAHTFSKWLLNGKEYNFNSPVTGNITLLATWTENRKYKVEAEKVDNFSTDVRLTVKDGSTVINYESISYTDGTNICAKNPCVVAASNIKGESRLLVKVNGTYYYANIQ